MERQDLENLLLQKMQYEVAFKNGYSNVLYSDEEHLDIPTVDYTRFDSIGYYDGFNYGDYCVKVGMQWDIKPDNLIAQIDKCFTQALKKYDKAINKEERPKIR